MTYEELVTKVKEATKNARVSKTVGHVAFQFNVRGEAEGAFYLEICDGKINVEPYEYYDRDVIIETTADVLIQMLEGGLLPRIAFAKLLIMPTCWKFSPSVSTSIISQFGFAKPFSAVRECSMLSASFLYQISLSPSQRSFPFVPEISKRFVPGVSPVVVMNTPVAPFA